MAGAVPEKAVVGLLTLAIGLGRNSPFYPAGKPVELWYVRRCPPLLDLVNYHVLFTTPYVLIGATKTDWTAYLKKSVLGVAEPRKALHEFLKFGKATKSRKPDESWNEFIFQAYHHHQPNAIFLTGLPDVKGSLPHA